MKPINAAASNHNKTLPGSVRIRSGRRPSIIIIIINNTADKIYKIVKFMSV